MSSFGLLAFLGGSLSGGEIIVVFIAVLILFGSKNVPHIARTIGRSLEEFRKASRGVTDEIMRADVRDESRPSLKPPIAHESTGADKEVGEEDLPAPRASAHSVQRHEPGE